MSVRFDEDSARDYKNTWGHAPRGYGMWIFSLGRAGAWTDYTHTGTYSQGKKDAMTLARSLGCDTVVVRS